MATLGSRIDYHSFNLWKADLPKKSTFHKDGNLERAHAYGKHFEGVAGTWDHSKNSGWIYAYYLKKENLLESVMSFEEYLSENSKGIFAIKILGKWHEDQQLPWRDVHTILTAINGEKENVGAITDWFLKNYRISGNPHVEILDMSASPKGSDTIVVEIHWTTTEDRHLEKKTEIWISKE